MRIFDIKKEGQGYEMRRRRLRRLMAFCMTYNIAKNGGFTTNRFRVVHK